MRRILCTIVALAACADAASRTVKKKAKVEIDESKLPPLAEVLTDLELDEFAQPLLELGQRRRRSLAARCRLRAGLRRRLLRRLLQHWWGLGHGRVPHLGPWRRRGPERPGGKSAPRLSTAGRRPNGEGVDQQGTAWPRHPEVGNAVSQAG